MRREDWPSRLIRFLEMAEKRPFERGRWDCALLVAEWVNEATGQDFGAEWRGQYHDLKGAYAELRARKVTLEGAVTRALGKPLENPREAQRGDIVSIKPAGQRYVAIGVCAGPRVAVIGPAGFAYLPMTQARKAWRV